MTNETTRGKGPTRNQSTDTQPDAPDAENRCVADGGQPDDDRAGPRGYHPKGTRVIPENAAGVSTDPATRAYIHILRALGLQQAEIGDRIGMSRKAVQNALSATADRVRDGEDPLDVYADVLAPILTVGPPAEADAAAGGGDGDPDVVPDGGLDIRALREFEADKNAVYSELADLIGEYGYEPTLAACAELVSRRVDDEMAEAYADAEDGNDVVPDGGRERRYPNPYQAAMVLAPGRERLGAMRQFLEDEQHRLHERLNEIENDDGSIPEESTDEWSMAKGKLDQTRLVHGLVIQGILTVETEVTDDE